MWVRGDGAIEGSFLGQSYRLIEGLCNFTGPNILLPLGRNEPDETGPLWAAPHHLLSDFARASDLAGEGTARRHAHTKTGLE